MKKVGDIIKKGEYKNPLVKRIFTPSQITSGNFAQAFLENVSLKMKFSKDPFIVDDQNRAAINQLFYFLTGSNKFEGDDIKGLLIMGPFGTGKTIIMEAFISIFNNQTNKHIVSINSKDIPRIIEESVIGYLNKRPLFIDDIGKEQTVVNNYGTVSKPFEDVINARYNSGAFTLGTTNLKFIDMPYNKHTIDRMRQMFNVIVLPGKSRR